MTSKTLEPHGGQNNSTRDRVLAKLLEGNQRFVQGKLSNKDIGPTKRASLLKGQTPIAIILTCSDSRVPPELIFDQSLGDLFVIRSAGNVVDPIGIGSIEYAALHLNTPLLIILGHSHCGAITAAVDTDHEPEGNIKAIIETISPAVLRAKEIANTKQEIIEAAIRENVFLMENKILTNSAPIRNLVQKGEFGIVKAVYNMATGVVEIL